MKKIIGIALVALAAALCIAASDFQPQEISFQYQMNGSWLPNVHPLHVGANNYTTLQNLRPTDTGYETIEGYSKINTTLIATPANVHQFYKTGESHLLAKATSGSSVYLFENTTAIPGTGDFNSTPLYTVASGAGSFANGSKGTMFYADGTHNLVWGGNEIDPIGVFYSSESDATDISDVTDKVTNDVTTEAFVWGSGGNDADAVLLLQADDQADAATTITDSSTGGGGSPHTVTANGDAQIDTAYKKFDVGSILFDGTGDYASITDHADFASIDIDFWFKINSISASTTQGLYGQYDDASNYTAINIVDNGDGTQRIDLILKDSPQDHTLSSSNLDLDDGQWHHIDASQIGLSSGSGSYDLFVDGVLEDQIVVGFPATFDFSGDVEIGRTYNGATFDYFNGAIDEFRVSEIGRWAASTGFTPTTFAYSTADNDYVYVSTPFKLDGIKVYLSGVNGTTSSITGAVWTGDTFTALTVTDNTSAGGIALSQTGTVTFGYNDDARLTYIDGKTLYLYRFALSAGSAVIYKITASAPLQPIRDVWNQAPRTCISFQFIDGSVTKEFTFQVSAKDSTDDSLYAAEIGTATNSDSIIIMFDDRTMGINFSMVSSMVNSAADKINKISYWNGSAYTTVGYFKDGTLDSGGTKSFTQSGTVSWNPPPESNEQPQEIYGVKGYAYKLEFANATPLSATVDIDLVTGITSPLELRGYDRVATYNGRVILIEGNRADYSQTYYPWIFNGVDSSDDQRLSLYFGDDNDIVATTNLFNRYGSNLIETMVAFKKNSISILSGSQPYPQYSDPFVIKEVSNNIGCAAPLTVNSYQMDVSDGLRMSVIMWLDFSGPYYYNGAEPSKIKGVENFFDKSEANSINYSYIDKSVAYIDTVNDQWNLLIPIGSATVPNKWLVYDFRYKKWFEKVPTTYPTLATHVVDTNGARYNYGFLSTGQMLRLDNTQAWDGTAISQNVTTGYFSPSVKENDGYGFWTRSKLRALRLLSDPISEDQDVTATVYDDGSASSNVLTIPLDSSGIISKNSVHSGNLDDAADFFQIKFAASTSSEKWKPLAWGYKAVELKED